MLLSYIRYLLFLCEQIMIHGVVTGPGNCISINLSTYISAVS